MYLDRKHQASSALAAELADTGTETVEHCLLCDKSNVVPDARWDQLLCLISPFGTKRCCRCNLRWLSPRPDQDGLRIIYSDEHYFHSEVVAGYSQCAQERTAYFRNRVRKLAGLGVRTLLDYGAATGEFVALAKEAGIDAIGVEFSDAARRTAAENHGIDLLSPERAQALDVGFDAIHMNHVLEHMPNPSIHLRWCHDRLNEGGLLVSEVPNQFDNLTDRLRRLRKAGGQQARFDAYSVHHTYFFNPSNYRQLIERAGFKVESLTTPLTENPHIRSYSRRVVERLLQMSATVFKTGDAIEAYARKRTNF